MNHLAIGGVLQEKNELSIKSLYWSRHDGCLDGFHGLLSQRIGVPRLSLHSPFSEASMNG